MERIDSVNHDPNGNGEGKRGFHGGNSLIGVKATYWTPKWANYVQEEIANVIEGFGVALDGTKKNQMFEVLAAKIGDAQNTKTITDWNLAVTNGIFMGKDAANAPLEGWWIGRVEAHNTGWLTQYVAAFTADAPNDSFKFKRQRNNDAWGDWHRIRETEAEGDARWVTGQQLYDSNQYNENTFYKKSGGELSGVMLATSGIGVNAGVKGGGDPDTGREWPIDGVLQDIVNGEVVHKMTNIDHTFYASGRRFSLQGDGNVVVYNADNSVLWASLNTYQKNEADARFINAATDTMLGVFRAKDGTGINSGIKGGSDIDTGREWPIDGVLQDIVNGEVVHKMTNIDHTFYASGRRFSLQGDGNVVVYNADDSVLWASLNTYQKKDYTGGGTNIAKWRRFPDPSSPTGFLIEQNIQVTMGQYTVANAFIVIGATWPIPFPNAVISVSNSMLTGIANTGSSNVSVEGVNNQGATVTYGGSRVPLTPVVSITILGY